MAFLAIASPYLIILEVEYFLRADTELSYSGAMSRGELICTAMSVALLPCHACKGSLMPLS